MLTGIEKQETLFMGYQMQWKMCPGIHYWYKHPRTHILMFVI